jgi:hypothetical protein
MRSGRGATIAREVCSAYLVWSRGAGSGSVAVGDEVGTEGTGQE